MKKFRYLSIEDVEWAHERILDVTGGERGDLAKANLEFVLEAVKDVGRDISFEKSLVKKAAFLLHNLVTRHPFVNGNKRTAIEIAKTFLELNGFSLRARTEQTAIMVTRVGTGEISQAQVEEWIVMNLVKKALRKRRER